MAKRELRMVSLLAVVVAHVGLGLGTRCAKFRSSRSRAAALKKYDRDGDGRLSDTEREVMRKQVFEQRRREVGNGRGRMAFQFPPEIVEKYDRDGDGQLNEEESQAARAGIQKIFQELQKKYDANGNGHLDPEEMEKLQADGAAGKLEGVPRMFFRMGGPRRGRRSPGERPSAQDIARQMDRDGDGRLNEEELKAARAALEKLQSPSTAEPQR